ncbi:MAG: U-box domain-containing protein [Pseudomonadota bacterium]|nr:U-box domain-containing protein [Pseudomonadota bacterium]
MKKTTFTALRTLSYYFILPFFISALLTQIICVLALKISFSIELFSLCFIGINLLQGTYSAYISLFGNRPQPPRPGPRPRPSGRVENRFYRDQQQNNEVDILNIRISERDTNNSIRTNTNTQNPRVNLDNQQLSTSIYASQPYRNVIAKPREIKIHEHSDLVKSIGKSYPEVHDKLCNPDLDLICPLSIDIITNPVKADDGNTYEEQLIKKWLEKNSTSPLKQIHISKTLCSDDNYKQNLKKAFDKEISEQTEKCRNFVNELEKKNPCLYEILCDNPDYDLICPITRELIREPVRAEDGIRYEKENISKWLNSNSRKSPSTRQVIGKNFIRDFGYIKLLKDAIENIKSRMPTMRQV